MLLVLAWIVIGGALGVAALISWSATPPVDAGAHARADRLSEELDAWNGKLERDERTPGGRREPA